MAKITFTIEVENEQELMKYIKASDMACFIFELVNNGWRDFKHTDYDYQKSWDKVNALLDFHNINVDELL